MCVNLHRHANNVIATAREKTDPLSHGFTIPAKNVVFRSAAAAGTFVARDNVSNFISWCRKSIAVRECLLFETDDLVLRKNEKSFILCLLEVARKGSQLGMAVPLLVQMEQEIDLELEADANAKNGDNSLQNGGHQLVSVAQVQVITNDLKSLHERVSLKRERSCKLIEL